MIKDSGKPLLFMCSGAGNCSKLSTALADELVQNELAELADAALIFDKKNFNHYRHRKMIFLNDCPVACIKELIDMHNLDNDQYVYVNLIEYQGSGIDFNIPEFFENDFFKKMN